MKFLVFIILMCFYTAFASNCVLTTWGRTDGKITGGHDYLTLPGNDDLIKGYDFEYPNVRFYLF